jgi:hypothetical protein
MNTSEAKRTFSIRVEGLPTLRVAGDTLVEIDPTASRMLPVRVRVEAEAAPPGTHRIAFIVSAVDSAGVAVREGSVFIVR